MTKDQITRLHNSVTKLHHLTNEATKGTSVFDFAEALNVTIDILELLRDHIDYLKDDVRRSILTKMEPVKTEVKKPIAPPTELTKS